MDREEVRQQYIRIALEETRKMLDEDHCPKTAQILLKVESEIQQLNLNAAGALDAAMICPSAIERWRPTVRRAIRRACGTLRPS